MVECNIKHYYFQWTVNGKPGLHGQAVRMIAVQLMAPEIKRELGQAFQIHQPMVGKLVTQVMRVAINLVVRSVLVSICKLVKDISR